LDEESNGSSSLPVSHKHPARRLAGQGGGATAPERKKLSFLEKK